MIHFIIITIALLTDPLLLFDFDKNTSLDSWVTVDDVVMGGRSDGRFTINEEGHGVFSGEVSLENNGGFSSLRHRMNTLNVNEYNKLKIRIKGDGKKYQIRVKSNSRQRHSYIQYFTTSGDWEEITIPLSDMYPTFRGFRLDIPNFNHDQISEIAFLIGNKKEESFQLMIDRIELIP